MPMEAVDDLRESRPPMELMEHVDCRREPILEPGDGVSSIGTLLLALARLELCRARARKGERDTALGIGRAGARAWLTL